MFLTFEQAITVWTLFTMTLVQDLPIAGSKLSQGAGASHPPASPIIGLKLARQVDD